MSKLVQELINEIKERAKIDSDNKVAKLVDIDPSHLNIMKKRAGKPDALNYMKLADGAGWDIKKAREKIEAGYVEIWLMIGIALMSVLYFVGITQTAPIQALAQTWSAVHCILC